LEKKGKVFILEMSQKRGWKSAALKKKYVQLLGRK